MKRSFHLATVLLAALGAASQACATSVVIDGDIPDASSKDGSGPDAAIADVGTPDDVSTPPPDAASDASPVDAGTGVAILQINEVNPNLAGSIDLIELHVVTGGSTAAITVEQDIGTKALLATLPAITVAQSDLIVVHLTPGIGVTNETTTKSACADASCYSGAWDVRGEAAGLTYSGRVVVVRAPNSTLMDGVAFYRKGSASPGTFPAELTALQATKQWLPVDCGGVACSTNGLAEGIAADWAGCATTAAGLSAARKANVDTDRASDWLVGASSFGATNP